MRAPRVAIVHDWLTGMRGGEKVLRLLCRLLPEADLLTLLHVPGSCVPEIERMRIVTSVLDGLPGARHYYRHLLGLMPLAVEGLPAEGYDLVISSSHCVAKGVIVSPGALHVCYCHTPMRYAWSQESSYRRGMGLSGVALAALGPYLRAWDRRSAGHVDWFVANSRTVAERIRQVYRREAEVIYPPVDTGFFTPADVPREDFYLVVSAMAPYKRLDQAIEAFGALARPLVVIGAGQQDNRLRRAAPANVRFLGRCGDEVLRDHYRRCRALVFPGEEDFGIVPVEAMACGAPVIAYNAGGATETVLDADGGHADGPTGLLYAPQTSPALAAAVERFELVAERFEPRRLAEWARRFDTRVFLDRFRSFVEQRLLERGWMPPWSNDTTS